MRSNLLNTNVIAELIPTLALYVVFINCPSVNLFRQLLIAIFEDRVSHDSICRLYYNPLYLYKNKIPRHLLLLLAAQASQPTT